MEVGAFLTFVVPKRVIAKEPTVNGISLVDETSKYGVECDSREFIEVLC